MIKNIQAIVLAAGKSTGFNTNKTKLAEKICGQEMILYSTCLLESLNISTTVIVGHQKELIQEIIAKKHQDRVHFVVQEEQHGTAHAIACARDSFVEEHILIMNGDVPLVKAETIEKLWDKHITSQATVSFVVAHNEDPSSYFYDRVVTHNGNTVKIVKSKELDENSNDHCCVDAGIYIVTKKFLTSHIQEIEKDEANKESYFTDIIKIASEKKENISTIQASFDQIRGINTFQELWTAEHIKRSELIKQWMERGVRFSVAHNVHIDIDVQIGAGSYVGCGVHILNGSKIGANCFIHEFSAIQNATLEDDVNIFSHCIVKDAHIGARAKIGPFAHVTENTTIEEDAIIGNFVEVKRTVVGKKSKAKHLAYLGDAVIGTGVNIGAGTITCNHDGTKKHPTTIKDGAYIGSNNTLVAPVVIEENAFTAAGSTITMNVPQDALGIGRARQVNKEGYGKKLRSGKTKTEQASFIAAVKTNNDTKLSEGQ
jgi:bifunctional UDP-N-acetylglucosamine pyrophosphorylase/glucosamine-1-phosphate N-acetyltransferase